MLLISPVLEDEKEDNFYNSEDTENKLDETNIQIRPPMVVKSLTDGIRHEEKNELETLYPRKHDLQWIPIVNPDLTTESSEIQSALPEYEFRQRSNLSLSLNPQTNLGLKKQNPTKKSFISLNSNHQGYGKNSNEDSNFQSGKPYNFNYRVTPIPNSQFQHEESVDGDGNRSGEYGLQDDHSAIKVSYVVGSKTGFQAQSSYSFSSSN